LKTKLDIYNHLTIDDGMRYISPQGLGAGLREPQAYVNICLSYELEEYVPEDIREMFARAVATMSYGIYHYPLFTVADDSFCLMMEASLEEFCASNGKKKSKKQNGFGSMLKFCETNNLLDAIELRRWQIAKMARDMVAHRKKNSIIFPNTALTTASRYKEMIEALFVYGPPNFLLREKIWKDRKESFKRLEAFIEETKVQAPPA